ncbi:MAG: DUF1653 domain-containing protein [Clostridia bacterium]|nr:DUF1653 domain-containing protein [Clostridia bacterium]
MRALKIHGIYKHFKGDYYIVEGIGIHSETKEKYVIYRPLYGDGESLYLRPYDMFLSEVNKEKYPNVKQKYRLELQEIESVAKNFKGE